MVVPAHVMLTRDKILYIIANSYRPTFTDIARETQTSYENARVVMIGLMANGMIEMEKIGGKFVRAELTEAGVVEINRILTAKITNTARTTLILSEANTGPITVTSILETYYSETNRDQNAIQNIYQRLLLMARDGFIAKRDHSRSMLHAEYVITQRGKAKFEGRDYTAVPAPEKKRAVRRDNITGGIRVKNPEFRIVKKII